jgi:hypothetical protein
MGAGDIVKPSDSAKLPASPNVHLLYHMTYAADSLNSFPILVIAPRDSKRWNLVSIHHGDVCSAIESGIMASSDMQSANPKFAYTAPQMLDYYSSVNRGQDYQKLFVSETASCNPAFITSCVGKPTFDNPPNSL